MGQKDQSLLDVVRYLYARRKRILIITAAVCLLTIIVSLVIPNYYEGKTTFYAGSMNLSNPESIFGSSGSDMYFFGSDSDVDRLMSIARSRELARFIIEKYDLADHYDIDTSTLKGKERLYLRFNKYLTIQKNKFDAVELTFEDTDMKLVAPVANDCRNKIDELIKASIAINQDKLISVCQSNIDRNKERLASVEDSIIYISQVYNVINVETQGERLSQMLVDTESGIIEGTAQYDYLMKGTRRMRDSAQMIRAKIEGLEKKQDLLLNTSLKRYSDAAGQLLALQKLQDQIAKRIGYDTDRLQQLQSAFHSDISTIITIEEANMPYVKSRPKRSMWVLASALVGFVFACLYLLMLRSIRLLDLK